MKMPKSELKLTDAELKEIKANLDFFLQMDKAEEFAQNPLWDAPPPTQGEKNDPAKRP